MEIQMPRAKGPRDAFEPPSLKVKRYLTIIQYKKDSVKFLNYKVPKIKISNILAKTKKQQHGSYFIVHRLPYSEIMYVKFCANSNFSAIR